MKKSKDLKMSFKERKALAKEVTEKIHEAYPMVGQTSGEDALWRSLTLDSARDLNQMTQKRMQDIAFYLYDSNPMAKRVIEIVGDFCVGDGFTYTAEDDSVLEVIDNFWNDPDNNLDEAIYENVSELCQFGENCFPVWVNEADGAVKLGYVDPGTIVKVKKDKRNPRLNDVIFWKRPRGRKTEELKVINIDRNTRSKTYGKLIGNAFYFTINKPIGATRGRSDLLSLADWLDGYDQFLFARLERAFLLNTFFQDIECEGMNTKELQEFVKQLPTDRRPGSLRAHNEKVKFTVISPKLEGQDASNEARMFKNQILGGAGYPEHWFAEGGKTTRATAMEMGLPTLKKLRKRQKIIKFQYQRMINFVIDQAIIAKTLKENVNRKFALIPAPIVSKDNKGLAESFNGYVDGLIKAVDKKWLADKDAENSIKVMVSQIGTEAFLSKEEKKEEEEQKAKETEDENKGPEENNEEDKNKGGGGLDEI